MPLNSLQSPRQLRVFLIVFLLVGLLLFGLGGFFCLQELRFLDQSLETTGKVIEMQAGESQNGGGTTYAPVFQFTAQDGRSYTIHSSTYSNPAEFAVGDEVKVLYTPADPTDAQIDSFLQKWLLTTVLCGVGLLFMAVTATVGLLAHRRALRTS